ncbi:MAG: DUF928 domain-containing protein [Coleofasciculaceae cyanobacterium]
MNQKKSLSGFGLAIACTEILLMLAFSSVKAQAITFPPTQPRGAPARTVGGGQRGGGDDDISCLSSNPPLTALAPDNNVVTTVSANPSLFVYVPKTEAKSAELVILESETLQKVYQTKVVLKGIPGIIKLNIPSSVALKTGTQYLWKFSVFCNPEGFSIERFVTGYIERTELNLDAKTKLEKAKEPLEKVEVYANAQVWQETLSLLAQMHYERPDDTNVTDAWREFLSSVKLEAIASQPLIECCTVAPISKLQQ